MKTRFGFLLLALSVPLIGGRAWGAGDSVRVESKSVLAGLTGIKIGIFVANTETPVKNIVVPLVVRNVSGGAFITSMALKRSAGGRLVSTLTGINAFSQFTADSLLDTGCRYKIHSSDPDWIYVRGFTKFPKWSDSASHAVAALPAGALFSVGKVFDAPLPPGSDGSNHSLELMVDVGDLAGVFEVDTICIGGNNHLIFASDPSSAPLLPAFTKGVITVACTKGLPAPSGPTPADAAQGQLDSVVLKWNPLTDSCGVRVSSYDVLIGNSCSGLDPVVLCTGTDADSCTVTGLISNTSYFWKVRLTDFMGRSIDGPCWTFTTGSNAVQYLGGDGIPRAYSLDQNYPNPFNASTVIKFNTRHDGHVRLDVYNILGQKVKTLVDEFRQFGPQAADWDGTDVVGKSVPTGLYFYRLVTSDFTSVKKMVLLK